MLSSHCCCLKMFASFSCFRDFCINMVHHEELSFLSFESQNDSLLCPPHKRGSSYLSCLCRSEILRFFPLSCRINTEMGPVTGIWSVSLTGESSHQIQSKHQPFLAFIWSLCSNLISLTQTRPVRVINVIILSRTLFVSSGDRSQSFASLLAVKVISV